MKFDESSHRQICKEVRREDEKILGVHIIGHEASTLISMASSLMAQGVKAKEFQRILQAHPTTPEALKEAFLDAEGSAIRISHAASRPRTAFSEMENVFFSRSVFDGYFEHNFLECLILLARVPPLVKDIKVGIRM
jgi:hypothetical protein